MSGTNIVRFSTTGGTASENLDYLPEDRRLVFLPLERTKSLAVWIQQDAIPEPPESIRLKLSDPSPGAGLISPDATLWIMDSGGAVYLQMNSRTSGNYDQITSWAFSAKRRTLYIQASEGLTPTTWMDVASLPVDPLTEPASFGGSYYSPGRQRFYRGVLK